MSDVGPNQKLVRAEKELELAQLKINIQSQELRILQMDDEKERIQNNIEATRKAITKLESDLQFK